MCFTATRRIYIACPGFAGLLLKWKEKRRPGRMRLNLII